VPDDTLHKTLTSAYREEVNGGGGGLKLHGSWELVAYVLIIGHWSGSGEW
jgi:hypothetical protein